MNEPPNGTVVRLDLPNGEAAWYLRDDAPIDDLDTEGDWWSLIPTGAALSWAMVSAGEQPVRLVDAPRRAVQR